MRGECCARVFHLSRVIGLLQFELPDQAVLNRAAFENSDKQGSGVFNSQQIASGSSERPGASRHRR
jgi:hypothetical protein